SRANRGHPLCPRHGFLINDGVVVDAVRGLIGTPGQSPNADGWNGGSCRGYAGRPRQCTAINDFTRLGPTAVLLPLKEITLLMGYKKTDATLRVASAFSQENSNGGTGGGASRVMAHLPFSDGNVYWDFGGDTDGTTRLTVAGLTFGDDIWAFTTGPRGMEVWQNGTLKGSNAQNPTRSDEADTVTLGKLGSAANSDLARYFFFSIYWRQLGSHEITDLTAQPFSWVVSTR